MLCAGTHLIVALAALIAQVPWWITIMVIIAVLVSWVITLKHYAAITQSTGDLCWSGESWLVASDEESGSIDYLELKPSSWITSHFCLLKFSLGRHEKAWLFTNKHLGERAYRELCYLTRQDSVTNRKNLR